MGGTWSHDLWINANYCFLFVYSGLERPSFTSCGVPFDADKFHKLYKVVPVQKAHILEITWSLPNQRQYYGCKPLNYLSWLIGHEGHGSILALLKKRALALSLFSGNADSGFEHNDTHAMYVISITLTEQGFQQKEEVGIWCICFLLKSTSASVISCPVKLPLMAKLT